MKKFLLITILILSVVVGFFIFVPIEIDADHKTAKEICSGITEITSRTRCEIQARSNSHLTEACLTGKEVGGISPDNSLCGKILTYIQADPGTRTETGGIGTLDDLSGTDEPVVCTGLNNYVNLGCWVTRALEGIMYISSWFLFIAATMFNFVIEVALDIGSQAGILTIVDFGWSLFRDLANILFIFIILWIGISTILNLNGGAAKKLLTKVIIMALLINFSLFFTKVIIDVSNTIAIGFYNEIVSEADELAAAGALGGTTLSRFDAGLSEIFMSKLRLTTLYQESDTGEVRVTRNYEDESNLVYIMGTFLILITTFVLFAGAILFIIRTIVLIFVMILAPLAYVGSLLPALSDYTKEWWDNLLSQAYFAPFYMILIFVSIRGLDVLTSPTGLIQDSDTRGFGEAITTISTNNAAVFFNFLLVIGMMLGALVVSKRLGVAGHKATVNFAGKVAGKTSGYLGRKTFGRVGERIARSENSRVGQFLKDKSTSDNRIVRGISGAGLRFADKTSQQSFDVRGLGSVPGKAQKGGFKKDFEDKVKKEVDFTKSLGDSLEVTKGIREENEKINDLKRQIAQYEDSGDSKDTEVLEKARADLEAAESRLKGYKDKKGERQRKRAEIRKRPTIVSQIGEAIPFVDVEAGPDRFGIETYEKIEKGLKTNWKDGSLRGKMEKLLKEEFKDQVKSSDEDEEKKDES